MTVNTDTSTDVVPLPERSLGIMAQLGITLSDPEELSMLIAERLALAATPEELSDDGGENGWQRALGVPFTFRQVWWLPSSQAAGPGFYACVDAVNVNTGESAILTCGSISVLVQLGRIMQQGWNDKAWILVRAERATSNGFYPLKLRLA